MTQLLVSVRSIAEADAALQGGVDILDVKEPGQGALGRAEREVIQGIVAQVAGRVPVSLALGELREWIDGHGEMHGSAPPAFHAGRAELGRSLSSALEIASQPPISWCKIGLVGYRLSSSWPEHLIRLSPNFPPGSLVVAAYADAERADAPSVWQVLERMHRWKGSMLLLDTWRKDGQGLFAWMSCAELRELRAETRRRCIRLALAGSLILEDIPHVKELAPDILAVRGAACQGNQRTGAVAAECVAALKQRLSR